MSANLLQDGTPWAAAVCVPAGSPARRSVTASVRPPPAAGGAVRFLRPVAAACCLAVAACCGPTSAAGAAIPAFQAKGVLLCERFQPASDRPTSVTEAQVTFTYSNPGWEINLDFVGAAGSPGLSVNCRRIPDGVRYFTQSAQASETTNQAAPLTAAFALPIGYPPPEQLGLLPCWLSLCPGPELPTLDSGRMRRFLFSSVQGDARNAGSFTAGYLGGAGGFLAELGITNDGTYFPLMGNPKAYAHPFEGGFLELRYQVVHATNTGGIVFPSQSILRRYSPRAMAKTPADVYAHSVETLRISEITLAGAPPPGAEAVPPPRMVGIDVRPPGLPSGITVRYFVTNDEWLSATNRSLAKLASVYARPIPPKP